MRIIRTETPKTHRFFTFLLIMKIRYSHIFLAAALLLGAAGCSKKPANLSLNMSDRFEGKTVELISYADSAIMASTTVSDGKAAFSLPVDSIDGKGLMSIVIDGRIRGFYVPEAGDALITDSMYVAKGTPLNDRLGVLMQRLDSVESLDDMDKYVAFSEQTYNENKDNPLGTYFGVEWLKYADPLRVDSMLDESPADFRDSRRVTYYKRFAELRSATSPGKVYTDMAGEDVNGNAIKLSQFVKPGRYTLVDFWASWCPYCIKELPDMIRLYENWNGRGLDIVGVAVRDKTADTQSAIEKNGIIWPSLFNTQRTAYDIYGFSGIPHHILIGPDGKIISRGESIAQIEQRLETLTLNDQN